MDTSESFGHRFGVWTRELAGPGWSGHLSVAPTGRRSSAQFRPAIGVRNREIEDLLELIEPGWSSPAVATLSRTFEEVSQVPGGQVWDVDRPTADEDADVLAQDLVSFLSALGNPWQDRHASWAAVIEAANPLRGHERFTQIVAHDLSGDRASAARLVDQLPADAPGEWGEFCRRACEFFRRRWAEER